MEKYSIPSKCFSSDDKSINNPNYHPVKIRIMSSGKNWNGSDFVIESLDTAKDTVAYAPILANIVTREDGELDANGHDMDFDLHWDYNGNMTCKTTYIEKPVGVFLANACEKKYDEENDAYYLESYGYIWKEYSEIYDILKRDEVKDVSMEISVEDGVFRDADGYYEIRKFNVLGCTILGNGNLPAIDNSRVEFNFSLNDNKEYEEKVKELDELLQTFALKGGEDVEEKEMLEQPQEEEQQEPQNLPFAEEEEKEDVCPECGKPQDECECDKEDKEEEFQQEPEQVEEEKLYSQKEMDEAIANTKAEFSQAIAELEELRKFKAEYDKALEVQKLNDEMDNLLEQFNCDEELVKELREKVINKEISMEAFELQLWRNNQPIKKEFNKEKQSNKLPVMDSENKVSSVDELFSYYGIPKRK